MPKKSSLEEMLVIETLSRMDSKLDKLDDRMDGMSSTLVKQQSSLDEHIRRTNLLEIKIDQETRVLRDVIPEAVQKELAADKVKTWEARKKIALMVVKVAGAVAGLGGGGFGLTKAFEFLHKVWGQ